LAVEKGVHKKWLPNIFLKKASIFLPFRSIFKSLLLLVYISMDAKLVAHKQKDCPLTGMPRNLFRVWDGWPRYSTAPPPKTFAICEANYI